MNDTTATATPISTANYTCHPIQKFQVARFQFLNGQLKLEGEADIAEFQEVLDGLDPIVRQNIRTVSVAVADAIAKAHQQPQAMAGLGNSGASQRVRRVDDTISTVEDLIRQGVDPIQAEARVKAMTDAIDGPEEDAVQVEKVTMPTEVTPPPARTEATEAKERKILTPGETAASVDPSKGRTLAELVGDQSASAE